MPSHASSSLSASIRALAAQIDARMDAATPPAPEPAPAPAPDPEPQPTPPGDPAPAPADPTDWKTQSRKHEDRAKAAAKTLEQRDSELAAEKAKTQAILVAAGLAPDTEDPAEAAKRALGERDAAAAENATLRTEVLALKRDRLVESAARQAGADVDRVRDSRAVGDAVRALAADATDADVTAAVVEAVTAADAQGARTVRPAFAAVAATPTAPVGRPPAASAGQGASGNPQPSLETRAADAAKAGNHRTALGLQIAKLAVPAS